MGTVEKLVGFGLKPVNFMVFIAPTLRSG